MIENKKQSFEKFDNIYYFIGKDSDGINYWLERHSFSCNWYYGFGYIETFTNNDNPKRAKDINSHSHFDSMIFNKPEMCYDVFKKTFVENPFSDHEIWKLLEYMKTFYTIRKYSDLLYSGNSNISNNELRSLIQDKNEYDRINNVVLPELFNKIYEIMLP